MALSAHNGGVPVRGSAKLGLASALLLVSIFVPPYANWREPINFPPLVCPAFLAYLPRSRETDGGWPSLASLLSVSCFAFISQPTRSE